MSEYKDGRGGYYRAEWERQERRREERAADDDGRWARRGWHTLHCWQYWIEDPERSCVCKPEAAQ